MLTVLSPAKSLDEESPLATRRFTEPRLLDKSAELIDVLVERSPDDLEDLMGISPALAELNVERFHEWHRPFTLRNARQAVLMFDGDVYRGLDASTFDARDFTEATKTLRILSGLYGVLRPLDLIQPYRLEMGTRLTTDKGSDLYQFWGDTITDMVRDDVTDSPGADVLVNLASVEYFGSVDPATLGVPVVAPRFLDPDHKGELRVISFYAKHARGTMAAWMIRNRVRTPGRLKDFDVDGYRFDEQRSSRTEPVFVRD